MEKNFKAEVIEDNSTLIYNIKDDTGKSIFKCFLYDTVINDLAQIHIETPTAVYDGPLAWCLDSDVVQERK